MFESASAYNTPAWWGDHVSKVVDMGYMFSKATALQSSAPAYWEPKSLKFMDNM